jgi:polyferredoxin
MTRAFRQFIPKRITKDQARDTGLAMVLLSLILGFLTGAAWFFKLALVLLVLTMIAPGLYRPVAYVWLGLSHLLGTVVSRILLTLVFFVIVLPVGLARRLLKKDSLHLKEFRRGSGTVMKVRDHVYVPSDIEKPY